LLEYIFLGVNHEVLPSRTTNIRLFLINTYRGGAKGGGQGPGPPNAPINTNLPLIKSKKLVKNLEN
jgi:hypothetical protein